jgi:hypothetical protein
LAIRSPCPASGDLWAVLFYSRGTWSTGLRSDILSAFKVVNVSWINFDRGAEQTKPIPHKKKLFNQSFVPDASFARFEGRRPVPNKVQVPSLWSCLYDITPKLAVRLGGETVSWPWHFCSRYRNQVSNRAFLSPEPGKQLKEMIQ